MQDNVRAIDRAFDIIELLARAQEPLSLTEIVNSGGMCKTTAFRLLQTLCGRHYVEKDRDNRYAIGPKLVETASSHINGLELQTESKPILADLRRRLSLTVHLGILDGSDEAGGESGGGGEEGDAEQDPMYDQAVEVVLKTRRPSISLVQRHLRIGYNRAARLIEQMERSGLVSAMGANGNREVIAPAPRED